MMKNRGIGFIFNAAAIAAGVLALILYFVFAAGLGSTSVLVIAGIVLGAASFAAALAVDFTPLVLCGTALYSVTAFYFITSSEVIGSYADYFSNIVAFGHPELVGIITATAIVMVIAAIIGVVGCFMPAKKTA